jgi:16S rRNA (cytosine967-C5)-methyltransferase
MLGGVVAYVTCSPHRAETEDVVAAIVADGEVEVVDAPALLPEVPDAARGPYIQLWPQRHGTDAMFCAVLRKKAEGDAR